MKTLLTLLATALVAASAHAQSLLPMDSTQRNLASLDRRIQATAYYHTLTIQAAAAQHSEVWSKSDSELSALLTAIGEPATTQLIESHRQGAQALNAIAEMLGISARAPVEPGREFSFVDGVAAVVPLPEPEAQEEEQE
jgi:hypothetical protein